MADQAVSTIKSRALIDIGIHRLGLLLFSQDEGWDDNCPVRLGMKAVEQWGLATHPRQHVCWLLIGRPMDGAVLSVFQVLSHNGQGVFNHAATIPWTWMCGNPILQQLYHPPLRPWPNDPSLAPGQKSMGAVAGSCVSSPVVGGCASCVIGTGLIETTPSKTGRPCGVPRCQFLIF
jgi:hypothetical protein